MDKEIEQICTLMKSARFSITFEPENSGVVEPINNNFNDMCKDAFVMAERIHREVMHKEPRVWTIGHMRALEAFSKQNKISVTLFDPLFPNSGVKLLSTSVEDGTLYIGLGAYVTVSPAQFEYGLHHESGHVRDYKLLLSVDPNLEKLAKTPFLRDVYLRKQIEIIMALIRRQIPNEQGKKKFDTALRKLFVDYETADSSLIAAMYRLLAEVLRYGEESFNPNLASAVACYENQFDDSLDFNVPDFCRQDGICLNLTRSLVAAELMENGAWDDCKKTKRYSPKILKQLDPDQIYFFRMSIRAASRYFPVVGQLKPVQF